MKNPFILYNCLLYPNTCYLHHLYNLYYLLYWCIYLKWQVWRQSRWLYGSASNATWTTQCTSNNIALTPTHCFSASLNVRSLGTTDRPLFVELFNLGDGSVVVGSAASLLEGDFSELGGSLKGWCSPPPVHQTVSCCRQQFSQIHLSQVEYDLMYSDWHEHWHQFLD